VRPLWKGLQARQKATDESDSAVKPTGSIVAGAGFGGGRGGRVNEALPCCHGALHPDNAIPVQAGIQQRLSFLRQALVLTRSRRWRDGLCVCVEVQCASPSVAPPVSAREIRSAPVAALCFFAAFTGLTFAVLGGSVVPALAAIGLRRSPAPRHAARAARSSASGFVPRRVAADLRGTAVGRNYLTSDIGRFSEPTDPRMVAGAARRFALAFLRLTRAPLVGKRTIPSLHHCCLSP
jgi:hypothetical protein